MPLFLPAVLLLVLAMVLGSYAGRSANLKVRRFFWVSLVFGLAVSALALGIYGEWWLVLGPMMPLALVILLRIRFPFLFGLPENFSSDAVEREEDNRATNLYNDGHENIGSESEKSGNRNP